MAQLKKEPLSDVWARDEDDQASESVIKTENQEFIENLVPTGHRGDVTRSVADKERAILHAVNFLETFINYVDKHEFAKLSEFQNRAGKIINMVEVPRVLVGVLGSTGSGKSSLINALLNKEWIVPTNAMRASTSCVVEISYNTSDEPEAYYAEIQFITAEDWAAEIDILKEDIKNKPKDEPIGGNSGSEANAAYSKISAVYPGVDIERLMKRSAKELCKVEYLTKILGNSKQIYGTNLKEFYSEVSAFIDSKNDFESSIDISLWPLVKLVKIQLKAPILKHGLVIVDLPGLGDSNTGRTRVTEAYMQKLNYFWIVTDIVRAVDDQVARQLLGRSFQKALLRDGKYQQGVVSFIATKTDSINVQEVIDSLKLERKDPEFRKLMEKEIQVRAELTSVEERLKSVKANRKKTEKALRKRKRDESEDDLTLGSNTSTATQNNANQEVREQLQMAAEDTASPEKQLRKDLHNLTKQVARLKNQTKVKCIEERNMFTQKRLETDFNCGLRELEQELQELDGGNYTIGNKKKASSQQRLRTFCVSSKAFQIINGRFPKDPDISGFPSPEHTNMPDLQIFAAGLTLRQREDIADRFLTQLNLLKLEIESWAKIDADFQNLTTYQREVLSDAFNKNIDLLSNGFQAQLKRSLKSLKDSIRNRITGKLKGNVDKNWEKATVKSKEFSREDISFQTWKAICRRDGVFRRGTRKNGVTFNWNEAFLELFTDPVTLSWAKMFHQRLDQIQKQYFDGVIECLKNFEEKSSAYMTQLCEAAHEPGQQVLRLIPLLEDQFRSNVKQVMDTYKLQAQEVHSSLKPIIQEAMRPAYKECVEISGRGTMLRMKQVFEEHVEAHGITMYEKAGAQLHKDLEKMNKQWKKDLDRVASKILAQLRNATMMALDPRGAKDTKKQALQATITEQLRCLDAAWAADLENPKLQLKSADPFQEVEVSDNEPDNGDSDSDDDSDSMSEVNPVVSDGEDEEEEELFIAE